MAQSFSSRKGNTRATIQLGPLVLICLSLGDLCRCQQPRLEGSIPSASGRLPGDLYAALNSLSRLYPPQLRPRSISQAGAGKSDSDYGKILH